MLQSSQILERGLVMKHEAEEFAAKDRRSIGRRLCRVVGRPYNHALGVFAATFMLLLSLFSLRCTLGLYIESLGGSSFDVGVCMGILTISSVVARPIAGFAIDMHGARRFFLLAGAMSVLTPLAHTVTRSLVGAGMVLAVVGISHGLVMTSSVALFLSLSPSHGETRMLNLSGLTVVSTAAVAPVIALWVLKHVGSDGLYCLLASAGLLGFILALIVLPRLPKTLPDTERSDPKPDLRILKSRAFATASLAYLSWAVTYGALISFLSLYGISKSIDNVGIFFSAYAVANIAVRSQMPRIMERVPSARLITVALATVAAAVVSLRCVQTARDLLVSGILYGLGSAAVYTPLACQVADTATGNSKTGAMGLFMLSIEVGQSLGAMMCGTASRAMTYPQVFVLLALVPIAGILVFVGFPVTQPSRD